MNEEEIMAQYEEARKKLAEKKEQEKAKKKEERKKAGEEQRRKNIEDDLVNQTTGAETIEDVHVQADDVKAKNPTGNTIVTNDKGENEGKNVGKIKEVLKNPPKTAMGEALKTKDEGGEKEPETKKEPEKQDPIADVTKKVNEKAKELADDEGLTKKEKWEKLKNFVGGLLAGPAYRAYKDGVLTGGELGYHIINNGLAKMMAMGGATDRAAALRSMNPMNDIVETSIAKDATAEAIITRIQNYNAQIENLREAKALLSERMNDKAIEAFTKRMDAAKGLETRTTNTDGGGGVGVTLPILSVNAQGRGGTSSNKDELAKGAYTDAKTFVNDFDKSDDKKEMIDAMKVRIDKSIEILENQIAVEQKKLSRFQGGADVED